MKLLKRLLIGLSIVILIAVLGFVIWTETPLQPSAEATAALQSDSAVTVSVDDHVTFEPVGVEPTTAFIFYPGGRVYGTLDMSGTEALDVSRGNLPGDAQFVVIAGGNHAQFGNYGVQPGDNEATIIRADQQAQVVEATAQFLSSFEN